MPIFPSDCRRRRVGRTTWPGQDTGSTSRGGTIASPSWPDQALHLTRGGIRWFQVKLPPPPRQVGLVVPRPRRGRRVNRAARRPLTFASLNEVMPDVDRLLRGHTTVGNWSLGQICSHLAQAVHFTIDGFPPEAHPPWIIKQTLGRLLLWYILRVGAVHRRHADAEEVRA